jgi:hypothetical protein
MTTATMQVAINWPTMFGLDSLSLAPVFRPVVANGTTAAPFAWMRPAKKAEAVVVEISEAASKSNAQTQVINKNYAAARSSSSLAPVAVPQSTFFGPLTTKVGTVIFGNVTKRLYHRYWCTTRNW